MDNTVKEPLIHLSKREDMPSGKRWLVRIAAIFLSLVVCAGFIFMIIKMNPVEVYEGIVEGAVGTSRRFWVTARDALTLLCVAVAVTPAFKMKFWNIGAEGQYAMGAIFGGAFVLYGPEIRGIGGGIILAVMCFLGGAFWALLCAIPKAYWNVNESITTLMLNYIALIILSYLVLGPWKMPGQNVGQTKRIPVGLEIPEINGISAGIILGIVAAVVIFLAYKYTTDGYQLSVIRSSQNSARYAGINIKRNIILALVISGGLAGLAGYVQYAGVSHRIMEQMPNNAGYTGIVIAYLSRLNPLVIVIVSILFAGLQNSSATVQIMGVPTQIATMIQGAVMIFVIAGDFFQRYKIVVNKEVKA